MGDWKVASAITILPSPLAIPIKIVGHPKHNAREHRQVES